MKILSIDPGYERLGIAVLEKETTGLEKLLYSDCFQTSSKLPHPERLKLLGEEVESVINKFQPEALSIETLFFNTNQKTAMKVSESRGTLIYVAKHLELEVYEFTPLQIKTAVTGHGRSDKKAIISMVPRLITVNKNIEHDDEYDAIAVGLTFFAYQNSLKHLEK